MVNFVKKQRRIKRCQCPTCKTLWFDFDFTFGFENGYRYGNRFCAHIVRYIVLILRDVLILGCLRILVASRKPKATEIRFYYCSEPNDETCKLSSSQNDNFWFGLMLNVPVNNFTVMLGRRHRFWILPVFFFFFFFFGGGGGKYVLLKDTTRRPEWGSNLRPLDPESEVLTTRPPRPRMKMFEL